MRRGLETTLMMRLTVDGFEIRVAESHYQTWSFLFKILKHDIQTNPKERKF